VPQGDTTVFRAAQGAGYRAGAAQEKAATRWRPSAFACVQRARCWAFVCGGSGKPSFPGILERPSDYLENRPGVEDLGQVGLKNAGRGKNEAMAATPYQCRHIQLGAFRNRRDQLVAAEAQGEPNAQPGPTKVMIWMGSCCQSPPFSCLLLRRHPVDTARVSSTSPPQYHHNGPNGSNSLVGIRSFSIAPTAHRLLPRLGVIFILAACVLLIVTSISAPAVHDIAILKVFLTNGSTVSFGPFGYCVLNVSSSRYAHFSSSALVAP
jgi:hypothetical protein